MNFHDSIMGVVSGAVLLLSLRLFTRKPVVVTTTMSWGGVVVCLLLYGGLKLSSPIPLGWTRYSVSVTAGLLMLLVAALVYNTKRSMWIVYNVTEEQFYSSLFQALSTHHVHYEHKGARVFLPEYDTTIRVSVGPPWTYTCRMWIEGFRRTPHLVSALKDFQRSLRANSLHQIAPVAFVFLALAVAVIASLWGRR